MAVGCQAAPPRAAAAPSTAAGAPEHLRARRLHVPVLRPEQPGADDRPRRPAPPGRPVDLGEPGLLLPALQRPEGRQEPRSDEHAPSPGAATPALRAVHQPDQVRRWPEERGLAALPACGARAAGVAAGSAELGIPEGEEMGGNGEMAEMRSGRSGHFLRSSFSPFHSPIRTPHSPGPSTPVTDHWNAGDWRPGPFPVSPNSGTLSVTPTQV